MLPISQAEPNKVYVITELRVDSNIMKHLQDLGMLPGTKVALLSLAKDNGIVLMHNHRLALDVNVLNKIRVSEIDNNEATWYPLSDLPVGELAMVVDLHGEGAIKRRLMDMGITKGTRVLMRKVAPLGDPVEIHLRGYELTLRKEEAQDVIISPIVG
ncbi:MAG: ferrous iron transport protein A [Lactobacillaceae bacterium]|jgi:ferrous iron transport protein A|nr:ferrous iron transport protein A [Lactobacillaceae bacterium]